MRGVVTGTDGFPTSMRSRRRRSVASASELFVWILGFASLPFGTLVVGRVRGLSTARQCRLAATRMGTAGVIFVLALQLRFPWIYEERLAAPYIVLAACVALAATALPLLTNWADVAAERLERRLGGGGA